jgi:hypothetical protein
MRRAHVAVTAVVAAAASLHCTHSSTSGGGEPTPPPSDLPGPVASVPGEFVSAFTVPVSKVEQLNTIGGAFRIAFGGHGDLFLAFPYEGQPSLLGHALPPSTGGTDIAVAKIAPSGEVAWIRSFGGAEGDDYPAAIAADAAGDAYVSVVMQTGSWGTAAAPGGAFVGKVRGTDGEPLQAFVPGDTGAGPPSSGRCPGLAVREDRLAVSCDLFYGARSTPGGAVALLDLGMIPAWSVQGAGPLTFTPTGDVLAGRTLFSQAGGAVRWTSSNSDLVDLAAAALPSGDVVLGGLVRSGVQQQSDAVMERLGGTDGALLETRTYGLPEDIAVGRHSEAFMAAASDGKGNVFLAGTFDDALAFGDVRLDNPNGPSPFLLKMDGALQWIWGKGMPSISGLLTTQIVYDSLSVAVDPLSGDVALAGVFAGQLDFGDGKMTEAQSFTGFVVRRRP